MLTIVLCFCLQKSQIESSPGAQQRNAIFTLLKTLLQLDDRLKDIRVKLVLHNENGLLGKE